MSREKKTEIKAFHDDLHDIMDGAGTMKDTEIAEAFVAKGWCKQSEGEWIPHRFDKNGRPISWYCSNCRGIGDHSSYCSHCGAKMKGGE